MVGDSGAVRRRSALQYSIVDGALTAASDSSAGPFATLFALGLGASRTQIGLLAALPALLGNVVQAPIAALTERLGRRRRLFLIGATGARLLWAPALLIPLLPLGREAAIWLFIGLLALRGLFTGIGAPAWTSLMADLTPRRSRGAYFALRNMLCSASALAATLAAGYVIRDLGFPAGYQVLFGLASGFGLLSLLYAARMPDLPLTRGGQGAPVPGGGATAAPGKAGSAPARAAGPASGSAAGAASQFRPYLVTSVFWTFAVNLPAPLFVVYFVEHLQGTPALWSLVEAATQTATILGMRYWGRLADRLGPKSIMQLSGVGAATLPLVWLLLPAAPWAIGLNLWSGFTWAGYNLAAFNMILEVTPDRQRTRYIGVYNTACGLAASVAPILGGFLADRVGIGPILAASGTLRLAAYLLFRRMVRVPAPGATLRELVPRLGHGRIWRKAHAQHVHRVHGAALRRAVLHRRAGEVKGKNGDGLGGSVGM